MLINWKGGKNGNQKKINQESKEDKTMSERSLKAILSFNGEARSTDNIINLGFSRLGSKGASKGWLCGALKHSPEARPAQAACVRRNSRRVWHHD